MAAENRRAFGFWTATALVVGGMIGAGIFVLPAQIAPYGWTAPVAWLIALGGTLCLAITLARLSAAMPEETGMVAICGRVLGPLAGALVGWSYWVGVWSANAVIAMAAVRYLGVFVPTVAATPLALAISAVGVIWLITLLNLGGARVAGGFQVLTTVLKLTPLLAVVVIVAGLAASGAYRAAPAQPAFDVAKLTPAITLVFYAMVGFEAASIAAERVRDPARTIPRAMLAGMIGTGIIYIIVCTGIDFAMPASIADANAPIALFVGQHWGNGAGLAVAAFAMIATIGCLNGWVLVQGEVPLGMARAGLLPRWFGWTGARDVPVPVLLLSSGLASILVLSNATRSAAGLLDFMLRLTAAATLWLYMAACAAALRRGIARGPAVIGFAFAAWALVGAGLEAGGLSLVLMLTALPFYALRSGRAAEQPAE